MEKFKAWWNSWKVSGTIVWARIQLVSGAVFLAAIATDLSPLLPPKLLAGWLILSGALTEIIRHWNSPELRRPI